MTRMKKMAMKVSLVLCFIGCLLCGTTSRAEVSAMAYIQQMGGGFNLGHSFDTGADETFLGNPATTKEMIVAIKEEGFRSLRIPVTWEGHINEENGIIDASFFARLDEVIGYAVEEGLYVTINMQHDSWRWISSAENHESNMQKYISLWRQIGEHYKEYSQQLSFEAMNEPEFNVDEAEQYKLLEQYQQAFVDTIRETGSLNTTRVLLIPTINETISEVAVNQVASFIAQKADPYLAASVQCGGLWSFSVNAAGVIKFNTAVETDLTNKFTLLQTKFIDQGIPVAVMSYSLLGYESGAINHGEVLKYYEYIGYQSKQHNIPLFLWDTGQFFNRNTLEWKDPELLAMIKQSFISRSSYGSSDCIYLNDRYEIEDISVTMTYHDGNIQEIRDSNGVLEQGTEYEVNEGELQFKKEYLQSFLSDELGVKQTIEIQFTAGQSFKIAVIQYETPILGEKDGETTAYTIPVEYNMDKLVTMEATYEDGSNAGPLDWTSYKEYGYCFTPNYEGDCVGLSEVFLTSLKKDANVILRFHFQSGTKVEYSIRVTDNQVIGKPVILEQITAQDTTSQDTSAVVEEDKEENKETEAMLNEVEQENETYIKNRIEKENVTQKQDTLSVGDKVLIFGCIIIFGLVAITIILYKKKEAGNRVEEKKKNQLVKVEWYKDNVNSNGDIKD